MENAPNISSEEELSQLRNEGKISEAEYQDLLSAMRKPTSSISKDAVPETDKAKLKCTLGKIACVFMIVGILLPFQLFIIGKFAFPKEHINLGILLIPGLILEIFAFTLGIIAWRNDYGKAAAITSGIILVLSVLVIS